MKLNGAFAVRLARCGVVFAVAMGLAGAEDPSGRTVSLNSGATRDARLYEIATSAMFADVNPNDARAAMKVWFDILAQQKGFRLESKVDIIDSLTEIRERLEKHSVDVLMLGVTDYLQLETSGLLSLVGTDSRNPQGEELYSYVLLVNPSSGRSTLAGLRGKKVLVASRGSGKTGSAWLDVLLSEEKLGRATSFFGSVRMPDKPQACILPLFFGTADACIVDEVNLNLAKEMNPQLGRLKVLARSPPLIDGVIAVPAEARPYQQELINGILSLHHDLRGRQLLMVFKTDQIVRIRPSTLDSSRQLWNDYNRLTGSIPYRPLLAPSPAVESSLTVRGLGR